MEISTEKIAMGTNSQNKKVVFSYPAKDRKLLTIFNKKGEKVTIVVPIDAPELDPYDKSTGKGLMIPNAIMYSGLSANAKLLYSVLRSFICYDLGVVFPTEERLMERMSLSATPIRNARKELVNCGVICEIKMRYKRSPKNFYCFEPESNWRLPNPKEFAYTKADSELTDDELLEKMWNSVKPSSVSTDENELL